MEVKEKPTTHRLSFIRIFNNISTKERNIFPAELNCTIRTWLLPQLGKNFLTSINYDNNTGTATYENKSNNYKSVITLKVFMEEEKNINFDVGNIDLNKLKLERLKKINDEIGRVTNIIAYLNSEDVVNHLNIKKIGSKHLKSALPNNYKNCNKNKRNRAHSVLPLDLFYRTIHEYEEELKNNGIIIDKKNFERDAYNKKIIISVICFRTLNTLKEYVNYLQQCIKIIEQNPKNLLEPRMCFTDVIEERIIEITDINRHILKEDKLDLFEKSFLIRDPNIIAYNKLSNENDIKKCTGYILCKSKSGRAKKGCEWNIFFTSESILDNVVKEDCDIKTTATLEDAQNLFEQCKERKLSYAKLKSEE